MQQSGRADDRAQSTIKDGSHLASLLRDLKGERAKLRGQSKDLLKNSSSNLARKGLRNVFLKLLFRYPFSSRTTGVESELWTETTLDGVNSFRSDAKRIEMQSKLLRDKIANHTNPSQLDDLHEAELLLAQQYVKSLGHFRTYIASELVFWRELMSRLARVFDVEEASTHLQALGIASDRNAPEYLLNDSNESNTGLDRIAVGDREEEELKLQAKQPANRQRLVEIIHKCLIACGDLARYGELYKENKSNESVILYAPSRKRGRGRGRGRGGPHRGGHHPASREALALVFGGSKTLERDYSQARGYYQQARDLVPSHGQSLNQIAVLYNYAGDTFAATYYYYRALCVTSPFRQAKKNMEATLTKAVDRWQEHGRMQDASLMLERGDLEQRRRLLLDLLVVLHGYTFQTSQTSAPRELFEMCRKSLSLLMLERVLAADVIVQVVVAAIASLWTRRLWRGEASNKDALPVANANAEKAILLHLLGIMTALMEVSTAETREALDFSRTQPLRDPTGSFEESHQVAKNITAVFRRILPAMRVSSKWLKSHVEYIERNRSQAQKSQSSAESVDQRKDEVSNEVMKDLSQAIDMFWSRYIDFINIIRFAFPFDRLPKLGMVGQSGMTSLDFDEDRDMRGFLPMKKAMLIDAKPNVSSRESQEGQLHPNEEHLIRIADLLIDAKVIAEAESSPIRFDEEKFSFRLSSTVFQSQTDASLSRSSAVDVPAFEQSLSRSIDSKWEHSSESTEDAVDLAMRAVDERRSALNDVRTDGVHTGKTDGDDAEDDDDGEIILIPTHGRLGARPGTIDVSSSPRMLKTDSEQTAAQEPLTAQHLFLKMLNGGISEGGDSRGSASSQASPQPSTLQPQLLFGGINSAAPQGSFGAPHSSHYSGTWNGNDAAHFLNQRQMESRQGSDAFAHTALDPFSPWNPPSTHQRPEGWG